MEIKFKTESDTRELDSLSPRQFMIAWTTAIRQLVERRARERIGGNFGDVIARGAIQTDTSDPLRHSIYAGGENGPPARPLQVPATLPAHRQAPCAEFPHASPRPSRRISVSDSAYGRLPPGRLSAPAEFVRTAQLRRSAKRWMSTANSRTENCSLRRVAGRTRRNRC